MNIALVSIFVGALITASISLMTAAGVGRANLLHRIAATAPGSEYRRRKTYMANLGSSRQLRKDGNAKARKIEAELPALLELMAMVVSAGESIFIALQIVARRGSGLLASELHRMTTALELGSNFETELNLMTKRLPSVQILEFCNKLAISMNRGTPLALMLMQQAEAARAAHRNHLLKQAGVNETRMLIPLVFMVLPITVLFAVYPSLELMKFQ